MVPHAALQLDEAIAAVRAGRPVIIFDDERECEGDLVFSASHCTPELINTCLTVARGIICLVLSHTDAIRLGVSRLPSSGGDPFSTPFGAPLGLRGGGSGVSAHARAAVIRAAANADRSAADFYQPGHVQTLIAHPRGLVGRVGHTEAALELMRLAGLNGLAVACEILNDAGEIALASELRALSETRNWPLVRLAEIRAVCVSGASAAAPLRHIGRRVTHVTGKIAQRYLTADGSYRDDVSGGPLLQSLVGLQPPPEEMFRTIGSSGGVETDTRAAAEQQLLARNPGCSGVLWASSGSDAVECALWAVDKYLVAGGFTTRHYVVRRGSYHGNTYLTRWLSTRRGVTGSGPCGASISVIDDDRGLLASLEQLHPAPGTVLLLESVPTTGSVFWPGFDAYIDALRWCRFHGVMVVFDEVAAGVYRHGWPSAFAWKMAEKPDAVVLGKGLTSGLYPLGCVLLAPPIASELAAGKLTLPGFTYGLSDAAAWCVSHTFATFDALGATGALVDRRQATMGCAERLTCLGVPQMCVQRTDTTVRLLVSNERLASRIREELDAGGLLAYESSVILNSVRGHVFLACPALDLPVDTVDELFGHFTDTVTLAACGY